MRKLVVRLVNTGYGIESKRLEVKAGMGRPDERRLRSFLVEDAIKKVIISGDYEYKKGMVEAVCEIAKQEGGYMLCYAQNGEAETFIFDKDNDGYFDEFIDDVDVLINHPDVISQFFVTLIRENGNLEEDQIKYILDKFLSLDSHLFTNEILTKCLNNLVDRYYTAKQAKTFISVLHHLYETKRTSYDALIFFVSNYSRYYKQEQFFKCIREEDMDKFICDLAEKFNDGLHYNSRLIRVFSSLDSDKFKKLIQYPIVLEKFKKLNCSDIATILYHGSITIHDIKELVNVTLLKKLVKNAPFTKANLPLYYELNIINKERFESFTPEQKRICWTLIGTQHTNVIGVSTAFWKNLVDIVNFTDDIEEIAEVLYEVFRSSSSYYNNVYMFSHGYNAKIEDKVKAQRVFEIFITAVGERSVRSLKSIIQNVRTENLYKYNESIFDLDFEQELKRITKSNKKLKRALMEISMNQ